ncbi:hypothetical protein GGF46_002247 [Coemansia sp. RSA 552]|nr:hypothetical protein GGF46_002247 [Coemansia sp. RSA 552]
MFSDNDGDDDSGSDSDLGNIRRVKRESGELDIGIVGASGSSRKDRQPDDTISRRLGPRVSSYVSDGDDYVSSGELGDVWYSSGAPAAQYGGRQHSNNGVMWDMSGIEITSDRMSYLLGPFVFLGLPVMPNVYSMMFGCQPLRTGVPLNMLQRYMTGLDRFKFWGVPNYRSDGSRYGMACFIARDGRELAMARRRIENRLLKNSAVLGPLLCYFIITLGCNGIDTMAGSVVNDMFFFVTGKRLESLDIVTERGIVHMPISQIWNMAKDWAVELTQLAARGRRMQDSLDECDRVNDEYLDRCRTRGYSMSEMDPDGDIARDMLSKSRYTHLFLGIQSSDLKQLYIYIGYMMGGMISREDSKYLKEVSASFRHRMQ